MIGMDFEITVRGGTPSDTSGGTPSDAPWRRGVDALAPTSSSSTRRLSSASQHLDSQEPTFHDLTPQTVDSD